MKPAYTITTDTITIVWNGEPVTVKRGAANFVGLRKAIMDENWAAVPGFLTVVKAVESWADGDFKISGDSVTYQGERLPKAMHARMLAMVTKGDDPAPLCRFWENLQQNPSFRSVEQLFPFLQHRGIPITEDGYFLAYKAVNADFKDCHTGKIDNSVGTTHEMPRNKISDDPRTACHFGFHVGHIDYARSFGPANRKMIICRVHPADVVCVPYDHSAMKMRVCAYSVVGLYGDEMPSTVISSKDIPTTQVTKPKAPAATKPKAPAKPKAPGVSMPKPKAAKKVAKPKAAKPPVDPSLWEGYENCDFLGLMTKPLDNLRKYATYVCHIVGASKIRGGKSKLVEAIVKARD